MQYPKDELINVTDLFDRVLAHCIEAVRPIYRKGETPGDQYDDDLTNAVAERVFDLDHLFPRHAYALLLALYALLESRPDHEENDIIDVALEAAIDVCRNTMLEKSAKTVGDRKARARFLLETVRDGEENGRMIWEGRLAKMVWLDALYCDVEG